MSFIPFYAIRSGTEVRFGVISPFFFNVPFVYILACKISVSDYFSVLNGQVHFFYLEQ